MTKGPISTAKRVPVAVGAASRAATADGRAAGVTGSGARSGTRAPLGSAPALSGELSGALVVSAGLTAGGGGAAASGDGAGSRAGAGMGAGAGETGSAAAGGVTGDAASFSRRSEIGRAYCRDKLAQPV